MAGVWVVEVKSALLRCWVPVSALGLHQTPTDARLASRALSGTSTRVRIRDLVGGTVVSVREADSGLFWWVLLLAVIIFLLMR